MTSVSGADQLMAIFGYWPTFHDAEVVRFCLSRTDDFAGGPMAEADVHVFEITDQIAPSGQYVLRHHTLVTFRFEGIASLQVEGFNNQNAISGLHILDITDRQLERLSYEVSFGGSFGISAQFLCYRAELVTVRKWDPDRRGPAA